MCVPVHTNRGQNDDAITEQGASVNETGNGRLTESSLSTAQNPALARLAGAVASQGSRDPMESYSRMHHRHNRS